MKRSRSIAPLLALLWRGLQRWLEMLGENPPLSRDAGLPWPTAPIHDDARPGPEQAPGPHILLRS